MAPPLNANQQVFASENFAGGSVQGNAGEDTRTLNPQDNVFPADAVVVVSFSTDGTTITRIDVFDDQAAFDQAQDLDEASETFVDQNNNDPNQAADGLGQGLQTQNNQQGDSFQVFNQPNNFREVNDNSTLFDGVSGNNLIFAPNIDLTTSGPIEVEVDLDGDGNESFDSDNIVCFAPGTPIATPDGERAVETLKAGDLILTANGRTVPVKWIGYQSAAKRSTPEPFICPVKIKAGALAENTPHTDLVVTGDHGILIDGVMVNASALVNGTSIVRVPLSALAEQVTYYHIETDDHSVILAAGAPVETYIDATTRSVFDNYDQYLTLFGPPRTTMPILPYARVFGRRQLPANVKAVIDQRAARAHAVALAA